MQLNIHPEVIAEYGSRRPQTRDEHLVQIRTYLKLRPYAHEEDDPRTVSAICAFEQVGAGFKVTTMDLDVRGKVPGLDQAGFEQVAQQAEQGCPVSNALRNNVQIRVQAHLES
jgi:OsmC-like protein